MIVTKMLWRCQMFDRSSKTAVKAPQSPLEQQLINDYLNGKGYTREDLITLPIEQVRQLMCEACRYASLRLAEIEARAQLHGKIHYKELR
jgi:hypothetical protein